MPTIRRCRPAKKPPNPEFPRTSRDRWVVPDSRADLHPNVATVPVGGWDTLNDPARAGFPPFAVLFLARLLRLPDDSLVGQSSLVRVATPAAGWPGSGYGCPGALRAGMRASNSPGRNVGLILHVSPKTVWNCAQAATTPSVVGRCWFSTQFTSATNAAASSDLENWQWPPAFVNS